ncbi:MAG: hypothetical protein IJ221_05185, partial [Oscillibacter sp.]|nr:hypothetical protein [Oscillibacter sp.]
MKKRLVSLFLLFCMLMTLAPTTTMASNEQEDMIDSGETHELLDSEDPADQDNAPAPSGETEETAAPDDSKEFSGESDDPATGDPAVTDEAAPSDGSSAPSEPTEETAAPDDLEELNGESDDLTADSAPVMIQAAPSTGDTAPSGLTVKPTTSEYLWTLNTGNGYWTSGNLAAQTNTLSNLEVTASVAGYLKFEYARPKADTNDVFAWRKGSDFTERSDVTSAANKYYGESPFQEGIIEVSAEESV